MKHGNVIPFPLLPIDLDRVCPERCEASSEYRDEPCVILILPVLAIERAEPAQHPMHAWAQRLAEAARILKAAESLPSG